MEFAFFCSKPLLNDHRQEASESERTYILCLHTEDSGSAVPYDGDSEAILHEPIYA